MNTRTLSIDEPGPDAVAGVDHVYVVIAGGAPGGGARWALDGITRIEIGRGAAREATRESATLRIACPDRWMSSAHLRFERERGRWQVVDAGSRNGILVNGAKQERVTVGDDDVIEAGRTFLMLRAGERRGEPALELPARPAAGRPITLDPEHGADLADLARIAPTRVPVLVSGPTGAGKERVARALHDASGRRGAFVPVNCGALPAGLVESELFGHKRGAFSGAVSDHAGLAVTASGGTLFLDEIGDLPAAAQAALLRVLEGGEVRAVGAVAPLSVDLRVVAASHRDLTAKVADGTFREDLYARLAGYELEVPGLAARRVDLGAMLAEHVPQATFSAAAVRALLAYAWPRNVRELARAVERAVALAAGGEITPSHLPDEVANAKLADAAPAVDARREQLVELLARHRGNVSRIAAELGCVRQQVQRWLKRYGLDAERYRG